MECIICYENITVGKYQKQPCCKNVVHWTCLIKWYITLSNINYVTDSESNNNNDNNIYCPVCRTNNNLVKSINIDNYIPRCGLTDREIKKRKISNYISKRLSINIIINGDEQIKNIGLIYKILNQNFELFKDEQKFIKVARERLNCLYKQTTYYVNNNKAKTEILNNYNTTIDIFEEFKKKVNQYDIKFESDVKV